MIAVLAALAALAVLLASVRRKWMIVTVSGASMQPALHPGDRLLVRRGRCTSVRTGQIAVLRWPGPPPVAGQPWMVKRIAAIPGDPIPDSLLAPFAAPSRVPPGHLVVLGDNSALSHDSRSLGLLRTELLVGIVVKRLGAKDSGHPAGRAAAIASAETWTGGPQPTEGD